MFKYKEKRPFTYNIQSVIIAENQHEAKCGR